MTSDRGEEILRYNPHINRIIPFVDDIIDLSDLEGFYRDVSRDYDLSVILTQSVEARYLFAYPDERYYWPLCKKRKNADVNYYEEAIRIAGYEPNEIRTGQLYFNANERAMAHDFKRNHHAKDFVILWALTGSSIHKGYLHYETVARRVLDEIPEAFIVAVGGQHEVNLGFDHPRVRNLMELDLEIRVAFALAQVADLVIGPESAMLNAAGCFKTPKICMLTHSSVKNLCSTWKNDYSIQSMVSCSPCYYLHKFARIWQNVCPVDKEVFHATGKPVVPACCGEGFPPEFVFERIYQVYKEHFK